MEKCNIFNINYAKFKGNEAALGGAVYILAVEDKTTRFSECVFTGNTAGDGGAVYMYTGPGVDILTASVFHNNFAGESPTYSGVLVMQLRGQDKTG